MIIGVSHIVISGKNELQSMLSKTPWILLEEHFFKPDFPQKAQFLDATQKYCELKLFRHPSNICPMIEFANYAAYTKNPPHFQPIFSSQKLNLQTLTKGEIEFLSEHLSSDCTNDSLWGFAVKSNNIKDEEKFWATAFNFKVTKKTDDFVLLKFTAAIRNWSFNLLISKCNYTKRIHRLNDRGMNCISFLVDQIEGELEKLKNYGITAISEPFEVRLNHRTPKVSFFQGPFGEIIELVEIKQNA